MHYKTITVLIFVVLMMLVSCMIFSENAKGLFIMAVAMPVLVIVQTLVVLTAKVKEGKTYQEGTYEFE